MLNISRFKTLSCTWLLLAMQGCTLSALAAPQISGSAPSTAAQESSVEACDKTNLVLCGRAEFTGEPDVDSFIETINADPSFSCRVRSSMPRLVRAARSEQMRQLVWKRMQRQELLWVSSEALEHIEEIAARYNMPLVP